MWNHIIKLVVNKKSTHIGMILEIFGTFIVLLGVVLFLGFYLGNLNSPIGFETQDRWMIHLEDVTGNLDSVEHAQVMDILKRELMAMDSVEGVSMIDAIQPYSGSMFSMTFKKGEESISTQYAYVDIDFMDVMGLDLQEGQWFDRDMQHHRQPGQIIFNQKMVDKHFKDQTTVGAIVSMDKDLEVSGIFSDYRYNGDFDMPVPMVIGLKSHTDTYMQAAILKMAPGVSPGYQSVIHEELKLLIPGGSIGISALDDLRASANRSTWVIIIAIISISLFLLINVAMGLFGVLIYNIKKRQPELALRMALGADSSFIYRQLLGEMLVLGLLGIIPGIFLSLQVYWLGILPVEFQPGFLMAMVYTLAILVFIILICSLLPAWQATRLQAAEVLKEE